MWNVRRENEDEETAVPGVKSDAENDDDRNEMTKDPCRWVKWDEKHKGESNEMKNVKAGQMKMSQDEWEVWRVVKWSERYEYE